MSPGDRFRSFACALPRACEGSHQGHADFRIDGRIFATLSGEAKGFGVLKLTVEQQAAFVAEMPSVFEPVHGGWGRMGMTYVRLDSDEATLRGALLTAYRNVNTKHAARGARSGKKAPGTA